MIPKIIHYFWVGGNPKPESVLYCIDSWRKKCPDYQIIEWNETNYDFTKNEYMRQAYEAKKWGFVPDYGRLDVVYQHGGIYLDTDVEAIKSFDSLLSDSAFMGFDKTIEKDHFVACGLGFGAVAGSPILKEMMDIYDGVSFIKEDGTLNVLPSPHYSTECLKKHGLVNEDKDQRLDDVMVYASDVLCPKSYNTGKLTISERTVSIHHFDATWLDEKERKKHSRDVKMHQLLGARMGSSLTKTIGNVEYYVNAAARRMKKIRKK